MRTIAMVVVATVISGCGLSIDEEKDGDWELSENNGTQNDSSSNNRTTDDTTSTNSTNNSTSSTNNSTSSTNNSTSSTNNSTNSNNATTSCLPAVPEEHRAAPTVCDDTRVDNSVMPDPDHPLVECRAHSDCTEGANGRCIGNSHDGWYCSYDACFDDAGCGAGSVCQCEGGFRSDANVCLAGNCVTDADCGETGYCSPSMGDCGDYFGTVGYFCRTCADECVNDADCGGAGNWGDPYCAFDPGAGKWLCSNSHCAG